MHAGNIVASMHHHDRVPWGRVVTHDMMARQGSGDHLSMVLNADSSPPRVQASALQVVDSMPRALRAIE